MQKTVFQNTRKREHESEMPIAMRTRGKETMYQESLHPNTLTDCRQDIATLFSKKLIREMSQQEDSLKKLEKFL